MAIESIVKAWLKVHPCNKGWKSGLNLLAIIGCALAATLFLRPNFIWGIAFCAWVVVTISLVLSEVKYADLMNNTSIWEIDDNLLGALADANSIPDEIKAEIADKLKQNNTLTIEELFEIQSGYENRHRQEKPAHKDANSEGFKKMMAYARAEGSFAGNATTNS